MNDTLKMFLIALITSVLVQFGLGPKIASMKAQNQPLPHATQPAVPPIAPAITPAIQPTPAAQPTPRDSAAPMVTPDYRGITATRARALATAQGIVIIEDRQEAAEGKQPGEILEQIPPPGTPMATRELRVVVAQAGKLIDIPDVVGKDFELAKKTLEDAGFTVPEPTRKDSSKTAGTVLAQQPAGAGKAAEKSEVTLEIASLPLIEVPKITGKYLRGAKAELKKVGLEIGKRRQREHEEHGYNYVLSQDPKQGAKVPFGSKVNVVVVAPN